MTPEQFETALRGYCRRRRFAPFFLEFTSGNQMVIPHPEAIGPEGGLYVMRPPDGGYVVFAADSVSRFLDVPKNK